MLSLIKLKSLQFPVLDCGIVDNCRGVSQWLNLERSISCFIVEYGARKIVFFLSLYSSLILQCWDPRASGRAKFMVINGQWNKEKKFYFILNIPGDIGLDLDNSH